MLNPNHLTYKKGCDYLQTRVRNPRNIMPNFALYCDWVIWNKEHIYVDFNKQPQTVYVRCDINALNFFINNILDKIDSKFILVTSSHDTPMPIGFQNKFNLDWKKIVNNRYLTAWFTENRDLIHEKIYAIPLGIPYPDLPSWVLGSNEESIWTEHQFKQVSLTDRSKKKFKIFGCWYARVNHPSGTCSEGANERQLAHDIMIKQTNIFDWYPAGIDRLDFLARMSEYQFVLCPHGGGLDPNPKCWEALLMKSIPIVKRNTMSESLEHLPIVIVDDWTEITADNLRDWLKIYGDELYDNNLEYLMSNAYFFNRLSDLL